MEQGAEGLLLVGRGEPLGEFLGHTVYVPALAWTFGTWETSASTEYTRVFLTDLPVALLVMRDLRQRESNTLVSLFAMAHIPTV